MSPRDVFKEDVRLRYWFAGRRVLVIGLGKSGVAAARLLSRLGAEVSVTEKRPRAAVTSWVKALPTDVVVETGGHRLLSTSWDLVVPSPGVPSTLWGTQRDRGVSVWGEVEVAYRVLSLAGRWPRSSAAVTGTNGKTTTTALLGEIFRATGRPTVVAGNIGTPLCDVVDEVTAETLMALEVSSYQLETTQAFSVAAGTVLNVTPDHLARHGDMEGYARAKFLLFRNMPSSGAAVLNARDAWDKRLSPSVQGAVHWFAPSKGSGAALFRDGDRLVSRIPGAEGVWRLPPHLPGDHNVENALAAVGLARLIGVSVAATGKALASFRGVEHRIELVRDRNGVRWFNDSKATNVDSTFVALKSFPKGGVHLILGGQDKGAPYAPLVPLLKTRVKAVYVIGEAAGKIRSELNGVVPLIDAGTMDRAVAMIAAAAVPGETALLSPACASFDQFDNFEHRGREFKRLASAL